MNRGFLLLPAVFGALLTFACGTSVVVSGDDGAGGAAHGSGAGTTSGTAGGGDAVFDRCVLNRDCILQAPGCCGVCGQPGLDDVVPINQDQSDAFFRATCDDPMMPCPLCGSEPNPNLIAFCGDNLRCAELDLRGADFNRCETDQDCYLRAGSACCEQCSADLGNIIALPVGTNDELASLVCDGDDVGCPECAPTFPSGIEAACDQEVGRCVVRTSMAP